MLLLAGSASADSHAINGKIAFVSVRDGNHEIYTMNPDGTNLTRLTQSPTNGPESDDEEPAVSLGGKRIAFTSRRDGDYDVYVMAAGGTDQRRLTSNAAYDMNPS